ncbi:MAG: hypothetical protein JO058_03715 [Alphaproteobacteria bacterium]|nr:hypothetical protein [Alphaproteobacteria bacterium]
MSITTAIVTKIISFAADSAGIAIRKGTTPELEQQGVSSLRALLSGLGLLPEELAAAFDEDPWLAATGVFLGTLAVIAFGSEAAAIPGVGALTGVTAIAAEALIDLLKVIKVTVTVQ